MRIKALITLVVSAGKEIAPGKEYDLNEADAKSLIERGFAAVVKTGHKVMITAVGKFVCSNIHFKEIQI